MVAAMKLAVVIPARNEEKRLGAVLRALPKKIEGVSEISAIVVSDASVDATATIARSAGATVLEHRLNLGAGGATLTGLVAARQLGHSVAVTIDADGQHDPHDIHSIMTVYRRHRPDLIIGSRFLSETIGEMPPVKLYGNKIMNGITFAFSGHAVTDSQSGFRLFGPQFLDRIHLFRTGGYEFCSEALMIARAEGLSVAEAPIKTIYFHDRRGQNPLNGLNIALRLFYKAVTG